MSEITIPADQPDASFMAVGSNYFGIFRLPHGRWCQLLGRDRKPLAFRSAQEATRAAMAHVNGILFRPIRAEAAPVASDPLEGKLRAEAAKMRAEKAMQQATERREVFRGLGKGFLTVETKGRRA